MISMNFCRICQHFWRIPNDSTQMIVSFCLGPIERQGWSCLALLKCRWRKWLMVFWICLVYWADCRKKSGEFTSTFVKLRKKKGDVKLLMPQNMSQKPRAHLAIPFFGTCRVKLKVQMKMVTIAFHIKNLLDCWQGAMTSSWSTNPWICLKMDEFTRTYGYFHGGKHMI